MGNVEIRKAGVCFLGVMALLLSAASPAGADPFGGEPGGFPYRADGADHWYCYYNISGADRAPYDAAMQYLDDATDMYDVYTPTCGPSTDIMFLNNPNLDPGVVGLTLCVAPSSVPTVCDGYWIATDSQEYFWYLGPGYAPYDVHVGQNIRHEVGHSVGLSHSTSTYSAMRSGLLPDLGGYNFVWGMYEAHHINDHINPAY
jgi:hypothetical protein